MIIELSRHFITVSLDHIQLDCRVTSDLHFSRTCVTPFTCLKKFLESKLLISYRLEVCSVVLRSIIEFFKAVDYMLLASYCIKVERTLSHSLVYFISKHSKVCPFVRKLRIDVVNHALVSIVFSSLSVEKYCSVLERQFLLLYLRFLFLIRLKFNDCGTFQLSIDNYRLRHLRQYFSLRLNGSDNNLCPCRHLVKLHFIEI